MTYCFAWKKDKKVYMIADSATSSKKDDILANVSTFGEVQGLYGKYIVQEGILKLYKVSDNVAVCFSGNQNIALEAIESIHNQLEFASMHEILNSIKNTYEGLNLELLISISLGQDKNHIYHFDGSNVKEIHDFVAIGSGMQNKELTEGIRWAIDVLYQKCKDKFDYIASIVSYVQSFSIKNKLYRYGVGGVFFGLIVDTKVRWCRDLLYYLYNEDVLCGKSVSVISRDDSIFSATDIDGNIRLIINEVKDSAYWDNDYYKKAIIKTLNTKDPIYTIFYSEVFNHTVFVKVNGWMHTNVFRRWIGRNNESVDYAYVFRPEFVKFLHTRQKHNDGSPTFSYFSCKEESYIEHGEIVNRFGIECDKTIDKELRLISNKSKFTYRLKDICKDINDYLNIVVIDFKFLCDIIQEKIELYKFSDISIDRLDLKSLVEQFMFRIASKVFDDYKIIVLKPENDNRIIDGIEMKEFFNRYKNCDVVELNDENYIKELLDISLQIIKSYYIDEKFFKLDKVIFIVDDICINEGLKIVPYMNLRNENPDLILVRNINGLTSMDGRFRYVVIDYLVAFMLGLSIDEFGLLESGIPIR